MSFFNQPQMQNNSQVAPNRNIPNSILANPRQQPVFLNPFNLAIVGQVNIVARFENQVSDLRPEDISIGTQARPYNNMDIETIRIWHELNGNSAAAAITSSIGDASNATRDNIRVRIKFEIGEKTFELDATVKRGTTLGEIFKEHFGAEVVEYPNMGYYIRSLFGVSENNRGWGWQFYVDGGLPYVLTESIIKLPNMPVAPSLDFGKDYLVSSMLAKNARDFEMLNRRFVRLQDSAGLLTSPDNETAAWQTPEQNITSEEGIEKVNRSYMQKAPNHTTIGINDITTQKILLKQTEPEAAINIIRNATTRENVNKTHGNAILESNPVKEQGPEEQSKYAFAQLKNNETTPKHQNTYNTQTGKKEWALQQIELRINNDENMPMRNNINAPDIESGCSATHNEFPQQVHIRPWEVGGKIQIIESARVKSRQISVVLPLLEAKTCMKTIEINNQPQNPGNKCGQRGQTTTVLQIIKSKLSVKIISKSSKKRKT